MSVWHACDMVPSRAARDAKPPSDIFRSHHRVRDAHRQPAAPEPPIAVRTPRDRDPGEPPVEPIVMRCLSTDPEKRPSAAEIVSAL
jgi:hypothetical protein